MHIAIVGSGQLARMLALAGIPLGFHFSFIVDSDDYRCVNGLGKTVFWRPGQPVEKLFDELGRPDTVTVEKEDVDVEMLGELEHYCSVCPPVEAIASCQHRLREKQLLQQLDIPTAAFQSGEYLQDCLATIGYPMVVKSASQGYDGRNQWTLRTAEDLDRIKARVALENTMVEKWVPFECEFSVIGVRSVSGERVNYPATENIHDAGILLRSISPSANISAKSIHAALNYMDRIMDALHYVGVLAMECFLYNDQVLVNELAPRVHNSGHWTQLGSISCQFENHIRAIANLKLGSTQSLGHSGMINLLGNTSPPVLSLSNKSSLHWYGKTPRNRRKVGHINFLDETRQGLLAEMQTVQSQL